MNNPPPSSKTSVRSQILFWSAGIILFFYLISLIHTILLPFVVGMLAAYFLDPAVTRLRSLTHSRSLAAAVITIIFFTIVVILCVTLVPLIGHQLLNLLQALPDYINDLQDKYGSLLNDYISHLSPEQTGAIKHAAGNFSGTAVEWAGKFITDILQSGRELLNLLSLFFITPIVAFYLLRDWDKFIARFHELLPRRHVQVILEQLHEIDRTLSGFIRGQTYVCLTMATYYSIMLTFTGLNFALGLGIMTGMLLFIPFVGFASCFTLSMTVALIQFGLQPHLIAVAAVYLGGMFLESSVLTPRLVGGEVGLHPIWIIFGMLAGAALFGFVGVLISVPVTSVIGVLVRFAISRYMQSPIYTGTTS